MFCFRDASQWATTRRMKAFYLRVGKSCLWSPSARFFSFMKWRNPNFHQFFVGTTLTKKSYPEKCRVLEHAQGSSTWRMRHFIRTILFEVKLMYPNTNVNGKQIERNHPKIKIPCRTCSLCGKCNLDLGLGRWGQETHFLHTIAHHNGSEQPLAYVADGVSAG